MRRRSHRWRSQGRGLTSTDPLALLEQESPRAAVALLGAIVTTSIDRETVAIRITEVEAYRGRDDPASHAFGSRTARNEPMFAAHGTVYIYRSYGIHWCMNFVTGTQGDPQGVLLRAGQVVQGVDVVRTRRGRSDHLTDGPGKLGQAFGITGDFSGTLLNSGPISVDGLGTVTKPDLVTERIGISKARDRPWRFVILDS